MEGAEEALGGLCRVDRLDSRMFERGYTKTFACWVWVWDVAHIPTKRTLWVMKRGAGCIEEMIGYSPPDRKVARHRKRFVLTDVDVANFFAYNKVFVVSSFSVLPPHTNFIICCGDKLNYHNDPHEVVETQAADDGSQFISNGPFRM